MTALGAIRVTAHLMTSGLQAVRPARWQDSIKANQVPLGGVYAPSSGSCPAGEVFKICTMTNTKALAHIVPDKTYPGMWRVLRPDGSLSDMVNKTRAKDVAWGLAENTAYPRKAALGSPGPPWGCAAHIPLPARQ